MLLQERHYSCIIFLYHCCNKRERSSSDDKWPLPLMEICEQRQVRLESYLWSVTDPLLALKTKLERLG